jgi:hypothetical protein
MDNDVSGNENHMLEWKLKIYTYLQDFYDNLNEPKLKT